MNLILDHMLVIQYSNLQNAAEKDLYEKLHSSPFRNYTTSELVPEAKCIYFMMLQPAEKSAEIYRRFMETEMRALLRIVRYDSDDYKGYSYIKIYSRNATRENMMEYLKKETGLSRTVFFSSIQGKGDVLIKEGDSNKVVKTLKKMYEPLLWKS